MQLTKIAGAAALATTLLTAPALAEPTEGPTAAAGLEKASPGAPTPAGDRTAADPSAAEGADRTGADGSVATTADERGDTSSEATMPAPQATGSIARATFTQEVLDREPTDAVERLTNDHDRILFFTELQGFQGQEVVHRWEHDGEVKAEVPFGVDGPRWRVYSSKALDPSWLGTWTVTVLDAQGDTIAQHSFEYVPADAPVADARDGDPADAPIADAGAGDPADAPVADAGADVQPGPAAPAD